MHQLPQQRGAPLEKRHAKIDTTDPNKVKRLSAKNRVAAETCENCHKPCHA